MGGKTSAKAKNAWAAKAYDRINLTVPKGRKAELQAVAERHGQSVNGFINSLIDEAMERERAGGVPVDVSAGSSPQAMPAWGTKEYFEMIKADIKRQEQATQQGAGGGATGSGGISIFSDEKNTPGAAVGVSPMQGKESLSTEQLRQLSPDDWAVWAVRQDDESIEDWKRRVNRSMRRLSAVDVAKRMGKLPEHERDILMGISPEDMERFRAQEECKRKQREEADKPAEVGELPF